MGVDGVDEGQRTFLSLRNRDRVSQPVEEQVRALDAIADLSRPIPWSGLLYITTGCLSGFSP